MSHTNTITSLYDLSNSNPKEYQPIQSDYEKKLSSDKVISIMFSTLFFAYIIYKVFMYQYLTNERTNTITLNLARNLEALETNIVEHSIRLEEDNQSITDLKADIDVLRKRIEQNREDINLILFSFKHSDFKIQRRSPHVPDILSMARSILERENIVLENGGRYNEYMELAKEVVNRA